MTWIIKQEKFDYSADLNTKHLKTDPGVVAELSESIQIQVGLLDLKILSLNPAQDI